MGKYFNSVGGVVGGVVLHEVPGITASKISSHINFTNAPPQLGPKPELINSSLSH